MSLKTRPRPTSHSRKRHAQHHKHGKRYIKPYLPYLPMIAIVAGGYVLNKIWLPVQVHAQTVGSSFSSYRLVSISGNSSTSLLYIVLSITFLAFVIFLLSHWYRVHKLINRGEIFIIDHPWADVSLVLIITIGIVLTRR